MINSSSRLIFFVFVLLSASCSKTDTVIPGTVKEETPSSTADVYAAIRAVFGNEIDPANLANYANQGKPSYIIKDNTGSNPITNPKATIGRVLFYDKNLSINNSIACASCHKQAFAFSDTALVSNGVLGGVTDRHSIRLINARYGDESKFFWDERSVSLEKQTTQPIANHVEMGYSGLSGRDNITALLAKLQKIGYYNELFKFAYGDVSVTEARMQECLAQFVRSIQSFDSKYDAGRALASNSNQDFSNFTAIENEGKRLFMTPPVFDANSSRIGGGLGCNNCHRAPEFDIDPNSKNNGIISLARGAGQDLSITRAPSLRDLVNTNGIVNGPMMHSGGVRDIATAISHYGGFINDNANLDQRLKPNGKNVQRLNLQQSEIASVVAFIKTLSGKNVYTDKRWSSPFSLN
jgi:cytochrome c peroxidase